MTPPSAGGVAGVLESLSVKWHMEANALDKSFSPGSGIMAAERRARALELEAALAAIGSAAPAGDGVTIGEFMGPLAAKFGDSPAPAGGGDDLVARLERSLRDLGEHRQTHVVWRDWLLKDPANEQVNPHAGSAKFHDDTIKNYDRHLANIEEAIRRLASTGSAPSAWKSPFGPCVCDGEDACPGCNPNQAISLARELATNEERMKHPPCVECGATSPQDAQGKCICGGDKDDCHGCQLWPDGAAAPTQENQE